MTTKKHGYKLHDKFQVINDKYSYGYYNVGMIVELVHDDGTDMPKFRVISGSTCKYRLDGSTCYIVLDNVQLLNKKEQTEQKVIAKQSSNDNYEFRIRVLEKENAFLTSMLMNAGLL